MLTPLANEDALQLLTVHYAEPHRYYHDTSHLIDVMQLWSHYAKLGAWDAPIDAGLALAYHDAAYDPMSDSNEETSAAMAWAAAKRYPADSQHVMGMILATKRHLETFDTDEDTARVLDIDLAGLGRSGLIYDLNAQAIRCEFSSVSEEQWLMGRRSFLSRMLGKKSIYRLEPPPGSTEARARMNIQDDLNQIEVLWGVLGMAPFEGCSNG